ncbi:hypothetical protein [Companilactobacillus ginsenosidimutans]|uniref:hypothetical protein n=1 Tax=Companilactobacillus ginsenosidimutans TaxID=1007676 RepID=UPI00066045E1|nr:hypothetical protein [Companilactobacillus ginsenosidimutans]
MKATKITVGILMILISILILIQSMAAGFVNSVENNGHTSGSAGVIMSFAYLLCGILYLATQKMKSIGGDIATAAILILFGLISLASADKNFGDLTIWIWLGFIIGTGFLTWHILINRKQSNNQPPRIRQQYNQNNYQEPNQQNYYGQTNNQNSNQRPMSRTEMRRHKHK